MTEFKFTLHFQWRSQHPSPTVKRRSWKRLRHALKLPKGWLVKLLLALLVIVLASLLA